eukprot:8628927-Lingulodinium_polyedra.AAC.1
MAGQAPRLSDCMAVGERVPRIKGGALCSDPGPCLSACSTGPPCRHAARSLARHVAIVRATQAGPGGRQ